MKKGAVILLGLLVMTGQACSDATAADSLYPLAVFVASTPCNAGTRPVPGMPKETDCELIKWKLQLRGMPGEQSLGSYVLDCEYGMPKQGTRGFVNAHHLHREGKWETVKTMFANAPAIICRLDPDQPSASISFLKLNDHLLHLLDSKQQLMIGTGGWSYTLNRIQP